MLNIEAIEINKALIHKINYYNEKVELAPEDVYPGESMSRYFDEHIRNVIGSASVKTGQWNSSDGTVCSCINAMLRDPSSFYEQSRIMAYWFYDTHENLGINVTYLAFVEFTDTERNKDYIAVLLLDPVRSFRLLDDKVAFEQVSALPDPGKPVNRGMIAGVSSDNAKYDFIFRNKSKGRGEEPEVGKSWTEGFLEGKSIPTPRQMTQLVVKETEKWIGENQNELEPEEPEALRETVKTLAQSEEMDVMAAANAALKEDEMKARYVDGLLQKGLPETTFTPDKDWAEKYAKKITYVCDLNVTVSGNSDAVKEIVKIDTSDPARTFLNIETKKLTQR